MPFEFIKMQIPEIILIVPKIFKDDRGFFMEIYKKSDFEKNGIKEEFIQDNYSYSIKGVLRGLHFQKEPYSQAKIIKCIKGEIFDVAVDIKKNSPTYGKWISIILSENNHYMLYIPTGFAHGFLTLSDTAGVQYKTSCEYMPQFEAGIIWNDPDINIKWPDNNAIVSSKDSKLSMLKNI
ncbi:MAG: dTDP-4-dehydrorhamnose 3,5-epimerase [Candidatus Omnitrophica bacterium]|jgi:dTDP-4-dehydrorhamnose 3,5-epimerase|nr:dTDP-4-dehydrorhamnose 3,5-epimerase [Candidatus Omnitrophota bacterium]